MQYQKGELLTQFILLSQVPISQEMQKELLNFLAGLAWPVTTLVLARAFSDEIKGVIQRISGVEAGQVKINLDSVVKAKEIRADTPTDEDTAKEYLKENIVDVRELRILRSLVGEIGGRSLHNYRRSGYYRPALDSLIAKDLVNDIQKKYYLTSLGKKVVAEHLRKVLSIEV